MSGPWRDGNADSDPNMGKIAHAKEWKVACPELISLTSVKWMNGMYIN